VTVLDSTHSSKVSLKNKFLLNMAKGFLKVFKMEEKIKKVIEERILPALQMDGGGIEFVGMDGNKVKVRLTGACHGCPSAAMTLHQGVERILKEAVPEVEGVISV